MKKIYLVALAVFPVVLFYSCKGEDKKTEQVEEVAQADSTHIQAPEPAVPAIKDESKISVLDVAPEDKDIVRRLKVLYVNSDGKSIAAVYGYKLNNKGIVMLEKPGTAAITLKQENGDDTNADYGNGSVSWKVKGKDAVLQEGGKTTQYRSQD
jgi:hypothetical protein